MNIVCVIDSLAPGGAQRQLVNLAVGFSKLGHKVNFIVYYDIDDFFAKDLIENNIKIEYVRKSNFLRMVFRIRIKLSEFNTDVVLAFLEGPSFITTVASIFSNWKVVIGERDASNRIISQLKYRVFRLFHILTDAIVANSNANIDLIKIANPFIKANKCYVIYNSLDLTYWNILNANFNNSDRFNLLVLASQSYRKNLVGLIKAIGGLTGDEKNKLKVTWCGNRIVAPYYDNSYLEAIRLIKSLNVDSNFQFIEAIEDVRTQISKADAIGLFSFSEGTPNAICEGMACGKPIICSAISDIPIFFEGYLDYLFDPNNIDDIRRSLRYLLEKSKEELALFGERNRKFAELNFNSTTNTLSYIDIFNAL